MSAAEVFNRETATRMAAGARNAATQGSGGGKGFTMTFADLKFYGPFDLTTWNVYQLASVPAVYILGTRGPFTFTEEAVYCGRANWDARDRMGDHLPSNETNRLLNGCNVFWITYCASYIDAYVLESGVYHTRRYVANLKHPDKPAFYVGRCPFCLN